MKSLPKVMKTSLSEGPVKKDVSDLLFYCIRLRHTSCQQPVQCQAECAHDKHEGE